jgi:uncharacterized membrane protein
MTSSSSTREAVVALRNRANQDAKCYGLNASYKNDGKSPGHSCAGQDSKARDPNAFVCMARGLCKEIAGGSLTKGA